MKINKVFIVLFFAIVFVLIAYVITEKFNTTQKTNDESGYLYTDAPSGEVYITYDYDVSDDLTEMINNSELIIIGRYFNLNGARTSEDTFNENIEVSNDLVYLKTKNCCLEFVVLDILKGEVDSRSIYVNMKSEDLFLYNDCILSVINPQYRNIGANDVLLFLKKDIDDCYSLSSEPSIIEIVGDKVYIVESVVHKNDMVMYDHLTSAEYNQKTDEIIKINYILPVLSDIVISDTVQGVKNDIYKVVIK